jgi:colanic acid/amylovoran biosynthesis glycosyltransferase
VSLRLGYLVPEFPGQTHAFFWREIKALRRIGVDVLLISTRRPLPSACRHEFAPAAISETHYLFPPALPSLATWVTNGFRGVGRLLSYLGELDASGFKNRLKQFGLVASAVDLVQWARLNRIDHIHGHSCADAAHVLSLARHLGGPPYSLTLHGDLDVYGIDHRSKMKETAFVCAVGDHLRQQILSRTDVSRDRVIVTCMGVETSELARFGTERSYISGSLHLVTVARLNAAKGHLHALAAVHSCLQTGLDLHYTIAGEGPHRDVIRSKIDELGLKDRVTLTGTLPESEVFRLLSVADAFVLPSTGLGEAWPVSVMEAMGTALPVISSVIGATPEMITSGEDGLLIPQGDVRALSDAIFLLASDVDRRQMIGEAARRTALRRFDVAVTAGTLRDAIQSSRAAESSY